MFAEIVSLTFGIVVVFAIIAVNGYFVAQEFAYMSVDRLKLKTRAEAGDKEAERALKVTRRTSFMLSGAQLGITVTGLLVGYVAEPFIGESLGSILSSWGVSVAVGVTVGTLIALVFATLTQMVFGELYPKNLAIAKPEPMALKLSQSTLIYLSAFGWLITIFDYSANIFLKLLRIQPVHDVDITATVEDLEHIVSDSRASGDLPKQLSVLIDRIIDFPQQKVKHAMIPRPKVGVLSTTATVDEALQLMSEHHTRYPIVSREDEPIGVIQLYDILSSNITPETLVTKIMKKPVILPSLMSLPDAFTLLTSSKNEIGCVVDEYGGFSGILTVEDLAEELVGEITDEHDHIVEPDTTALPEGGWKISGSSHIDEVEREINRDLPQGDYETIAGMLISHKGNLACEGDIIHIPLPLNSKDLIHEPPTRVMLIAQVLKVKKNVPSEVFIALEENFTKGGGKDVH